MFNFVTSAVGADALTPLCAKTSAGTLMNNFGSCIGASASYELYVCVVLLDNQPVNSNHARVENITFQWAYHWQNLIKICIYSKSCLFMSNWIHNLRHHLSMCCQYGVCVLIFACQVFKSAEFCWLHANSHCGILLRLQNPARQCYQLTKRCELAFILYCNQNSPQLNVLLCKGHSRMRAELDIRNVA